MVNKLPQDLRDKLCSSAPLAIAFSGGVDSRFLCHAALLCSADVLAIHVKGPHIPKTESSFAAEWAAANNLPYLEIEFSPLGLPDIAQNARTRCYSCKKQLLMSIYETLGNLGQTYRKVCDGSNADDLKVYRPGKQALLEAGVLSPLEKLTKKKIRRLALETGMDWPDQAARPCLLTRLNYGMEPTAEILARIAECEEELGRLFLSKLGTLPDFRVRLLPRPVLHLTAPLPELKDQINQIMYKYNFTGYTTEILAELSGYFDSL